MGDKGKSVRNFGGGYTHYDSHGKKTGSSQPRVFGGYTNYDAKGNKVGHSAPGFLGGYNHYDNKGHKVGHSDPGFLGGYHTYDSHGNKISSDRTFGGNYSHDEGGCYVATCVYGSYDCPEVWTLRRFRDDFLARSLPGRAFIRTYYAVSPTIVRWFGGLEGFRSFWKKPLDKMVRKLREKGVENTPYWDKDWRR